MFVCVSLVNGFCTGWQEVSGLSSVGAPLSAASSSLLASDLAQSFGVGFVLAGSAFLVAFAVRTVRRAVRELS